MRHHGNPKDIEIIGTEYASAAPFSLSHQANTGSSGSRRFRQVENATICYACTRGWQGYGCSHRSDVWSLAATVLVWMKPGILGTHGIQVGMWPEIWCMPKLMGLFPAWTGLPAATPAIQEDVVLCKLMAKNKSPGPDDIVIEFFQIYWDVVGGDFSRIVTTSI